MRARLLSGLVLVVTACSGTPTGGGEPPPVPTGTILVGTPNGLEAGAYLVDIETGSVTQIASRGVPLSVALQGGYSAAGNLVYGTGAFIPKRIMQMALGSGQVDTLLALPPNTSLGVYDLSVDGRTMAIQTATLKVQLWTVDLASGIWTQRVDQATGIDTLPLAGLRWSPDGETLFAITDLFPDRSELVRIDLTTDRFEIISPITPITIRPSLDVSPNGQVIAHSDGAARITFRNPDGTEIFGLPEIPGRAARPTFSPDGRFLVFEDFAPAPGFEISIVIMRLSDGRRWPLQISADFEVWLSDWL